MIAREGVELTVLKTKIVRRGRRLVKQDRGWQHVAEKAWVGAGYVMRDRWKKTKKGGRRGNKGNLARK